MMDKRVRYSLNEIIHDLDVWLSIFQESLCDQERAGADMGTLQYCKGKVAAVELMLSFWRKRSEV